MPRSAKFPLMLTLGALCLAPAAARAGTADSTYDKLDVFAQVLQYIQNSYVEPVDPQQLVYGAIRGMMRTLDPHSAFMAPEEFKSMQEDTAGHFGGVGIEVELKEGELVVVSPIDDTPAARAGLLAGDRVLKIDGAEVEGMDSTEAMRRIKGVPGTKVVLTIDRPEFETPREFVLIRERIRMNPVDHSMPLPGYGLVRIRVFSERTDRYLAEALQALHKAAGGPLKGLVLDLRNNPGGLLDQAVRVVDRFIEEGLIVETLGRSRRAEKEFAHKQNTEPDYPLVCLVNGGSASASEIVAGALQDHGRALLMGVRTFGKGSVQTVVALKDGAGLKLTIARYYTPLHRSIQEQGILPDVIVPRNPPSGDSEIQVTREEDLKQHFKNPGSSEEDRRALEKIEDFQLRTALTYLKAWERFGGLRKQKPAATGGAAAGKPPR
ncbi:MAG TPA: S41 family peptidase [Myxococcota bacterium]|nr:S41 family peptidase [Myxococcota bacterium]HRY93166.1 S41 family peptidase [Myxococcota bacterium]HSA23120.1 S41 family peptidase [Myxococcota bacterium]